MQESNVAMTEEEQKDLEKRSQAFQIELNALTRKFKIIPLTQATLTPDGRIGSRLVFADADKFQAQQNQLKEKLAEQKGNDTPDIATLE